MLQLDVWNVLFTVINLLILFVLMRIFLYKPVQKIIAARQAEADKQFDEAAAKQSEAEELKTKYEAVLSDAENEKKKVVAEAEGKITKTLILGSALAEATAIYGFVIALMIIVMLA